MWNHGAMDCNFHVRPFNSQQCGKAIEVYNYIPNAVTDSHLYGTAPLQVTQYWMPQFWNKYVTEGSARALDKSRSWKTCLY